MDPTRGGKGVTYAEMCSALRNQGLSEAQLQEHWSNLQKVDSPRYDTPDGTPRSTLSETSQSTVDSANDHRRVHFCDGVDSSCDASISRCDSAKSLVNVGTPLVEWIYIDRDICGFSLCEYAPSDPNFKDFASSDYGRNFLSELTNVEMEAYGEQGKRASCIASSTVYYQEESLLNEALAMAGVKPHFVYNAA